MLKTIGLLLALMAQSGCGVQPMNTSHNGQPCHAIGYPWSRAMVAPDNSTLCW
jgi:hypothetical protein